MTDRERLEAIVAVVCQYLPPDGISKEEAMREIISLVDPLPEKGWVGLTDEEIAQTVGSPIDEVYLVDFRRVIEKLRSKNT